MTEQERRYKATMESMIRFAEATMKYAKSPTKRAQAAARREELLGILAARDASK